MRQVSSFVTCKLEFLVAKDGERGSKCSRQSRGFAEVVGGLGLDPV